ncbi:hypothetical protein CBLAS_0917 [Campylobacter blaseri]|uniref:Uncharacterized protein n=1 Tax=Campylobacter blaseri TaxID=2042961 RepID=A0A2P8QYN3_9BACT|nr:hypothetical protein [Campylobacter blaseri]PSM51352.1 hypothetical protein CQ405_08155 [Campylobacter blaseri]PSM52802.1 hypothetical protein CRN67_08160 [Campylobacter blaseri]QKF86102.1 hypothetical protein CBLAS_0917 [Campylobacter blaseri]
MAKTLDDLAKKPKTISEIIVKDVLSYNAKVDLDGQNFLSVGTIVGFDTTNLCWKKITDENADTLLTKGILKDNLTQNGTAGILKIGAVKLDGVEEDYKTSLFEQNIIVVE